MNAPASGSTGHRGRNDLDLYERNAAQWWDANAFAFRSLHSVKRFHVALLDEILAEAGETTRLDGATVVDLGCGGGLFGLPVAARGARVFGVDISHRSLLAGRVEADRRAASARFVRGDMRRVPLRTGCADLVLLSDVLEHTHDPELAVSEAARLLRPGGALFVNTIDRGFLAALLVVHVAEGLGLVPRGTHDPALFLAPADVAAMAADAGLRLERLQHESAALLRTLRSRTVHLRKSRRGFGYTAWFRKAGAR
jgi:2-polyprenyl-6-hydroxyphenyl methylase/3-demethylubiquinone-9 3-methyltransferase